MLSTHGLHGHDVPYFDGAIKAGGGQMVGVAGTELAVEDGLQVALKEKLLVFIVMPTFVHTLNTKDTTATSG